MNTYKFQIQNLKCGGCASTIIKGINELENCSDVKVDIENSEVMFEGDESVAAKVKEKLTKLGYPLEDDLNSTILKAKSYVSCMIGRIS